MKTLVLAIAAGALLLAPASASAAQEPAAVAAPLTATPAGIPLDSPWRRAVYEQANTHLQHPSWGVRHSERNYVLGMALAVGLVVGIVQAATSVNEATLSFIPKLLSLGLTAAVSGGWMINTLVDYTKVLFGRIPGLFG